MFRDYLDPRSVHNNDLMRFLGVLGMIRVQDVRVCDGTFAIRSKHAESLLICFSTPC